MTRTFAWLSAVSCAALLAAVSIGGCGSSTPANNGKGGSGGSHDGGAGAGGSAAGAGGSTAGAGGDNGTAGAAGGAAGAAGGGAGATAGTAGAGGSTTDGGSDATGGAKADGGDAASDMSTDVPPTPCVAGGTCTDPMFTCTISRTCRRNQEQACFCDPNGKVACEACEAVDAGSDAGSDAGASDGGTDASTDAGTDGGTALPACPANVMSRNTTCATAGERCTTGTCSAATHREPACSCFDFGGNAGGRWVCGFSVMCQ